jgi:hypothetical protein
MATANGHSEKLVGAFERLTDILAAPPAAAPATIPPAVEARFSSLESMMHTLLSAVNTLRESKKGD